MEKYVLKLHRWSRAVTAGNISSVIPELQKFLDSDVEQKMINKLSFKLLQHVAHAAYNCDGLKIKCGMDIFQITRLICHKISLVPHGKNFFSSIYHIVTCLIKLGCYQEAVEISEYLLPEFELCKPDGTISRADMYQPMAQLWRKTSINFFNSSDPSNIKNYELLKLMTFLEIKFTWPMRKDSTSTVLSTILSQLKNIGLKSDYIYKERFTNSMLKFLKTAEITLNDERSNETWQSICDFVPVLVGKDIDPSHMETINEHLSNYCTAFFPIVREHKKHSRCFKLLAELCSLTLRTVEKFTRDCVGELDEWLKKFDDWSTSTDWKDIKPYGYAVLQLLMSILNYWEKCAKNETTREMIKTDMILVMLKLCLKHSNLYERFEIAKCRCENADCRVETDVSNDLVMKIKCLTLISRLSTRMENEHVRDIAMDIIERSRDTFENLKRKSCKQCSSLWSPWGAAIYNTSVVCEKTLPLLSIELYTHLVRSIVFLDGVETRRGMWGFDYLLGAILHRLSSICLKNQLYSRAKKVASINCLLSHDIADTSAFRDWANIKYKDSTEVEATILDYLRSRELEIPQVNLDDYDLVKVCLREIQTLERSKTNMSKSIIAVLDSMETLDPEPIDYAQGVHLLCYHLLNFETELSTKKYLRKAALMYERTPSSNIKFASIYAMIKFYEFVEKTREIRRNTEADMESALKTLTGKGKSRESNDRKEYDVVPAYSAINITITSELESALERAFSNWRKIHTRHDLENFLTDWEIRYAIHSIKIAGEYARLYRFERLENEAWMMIYKLADRFSDGLSIVYATSRSLTNVNFQTDWIANAQRHAAKLENSSDSYTKEILSRYKLCLTNFYYENNEIDKADELFAWATKNPELTFLQDFGNFLLLKEIEMKHRLGRNDEDDESGYTLVIVQCLYTLLSMNDGIDTPIYGCKEKQLCDYGMILDFTNSIALRMNSLLSYREISAHLVERLVTAQKLVTSLRVAECLKFLCYIDLSRGKLDDCEVKLQGLEHILEIEAFDATMRSKCSPYRNNKEVATNSTSSTLYVDAIRDVGQSDASPVLRKKVFAKPDFMLHGEGCSCFKCTNTCYQYLIFASTHIRAQLFALQANNTAAFQHFHGAMRIRKCILVKREAAGILREKKTFLSSCGQRQREAIEFVVFHLDYCHFLDCSMPTLDKREVRNIALDALQLCEKYNLRNHPVYTSVNEFLFQCRFKQVFTKNDYSRFMVPDMSEMDVSRYEAVQAHDQAICVTPAREIIEKIPISVRRRKTPPFLKLDRVPIDLDDGETTGTTAASSVPKTKTRRLRRKICDDEDYCSDESEKREQSASISIPEIKVSSEARDTRKLDNLPSRRTRKKSTESKIDDNTKDSPLPMSEATKLIENLQLETKVGTRKKIVRKVATGNGERSNVKSLKNIDEVTDLLKDMSMDKRKKSTSPVDSLSSSVGTRSDIASSLKVQESSTGRRGSARLRKKLEDSVQSAISTDVVPRVDSEGETIVDTRTGRRAGVCKEQSAITKKIVKRKS